MPDLLEIAAHLVAIAGTCATAAWLLVRLTPTGESLPRRNVYIGRHREAS